MDNRIKKIIDILDDSNFKWRLEGDPENGAINICITENPKRTYNANLGHKVGYRSYYDKQRDEDLVSPKHIISGGISLWRFDDILFSTREQAVDTLNQMWGILGTYDCVTVADVYDLAGVYSRYLDGKHGWTKLEGSQVLKCNNGYCLYLPIIIALG